MKVFDNSSFSFLDQNTQKNLSHTLAREYYGIGHYGGMDRTPNYTKGNSEKVFSGNGNSLIVLGKDRRNGLYDGYGGVGATNAGSIDLIVGLGGDSPKIENAQGEPLFYHKDFQKDSGHFYLSQKADIDYYFGLPVHNSVNRSAVALKADVVRVIGRENIRLITYTDTENSRGNVPKLGGTDLLAGLDDSLLQPIMLGNNTLAYLRESQKQTNQILSMMDRLIEANIDFVKEVGNHTHISPFYAKATQKSESLMNTSFKLRETLSTLRSDVRKVRANSAILDKSYLQQFSETFVNSRYHNAN